jgi:hypothetical protein
MTGALEHALGVESRRAIQADIEAYVLAAHAASLNVRDQISRARDAVAHSRRVLGESAVLLKRLPTSHLWHQAGRNCHSLPHREGRPPCGLAGGSKLFGAALSPPRLARSRAGS